MYECILKVPKFDKNGNEETSYMMLLPKNIQKNKESSNEMPFEIWTNQIRVTVKFILSPEKQYTVEFSLNSNDTVLNIADMISQLFSGQSSDN